MPSPYTVHPVRTRAEFDAVMASQWAGFARQDPFWDVWFPVDKTAHQGNPNPDHAGAVRESCDRMWAEHVGDPYSNWFYVTADDGDKKQPAAGSGGDGTGIESDIFVAGSCQWRVYAPPTNPFPDGVPELSCAAWDKGSEGDKVTRWLAGQIFTPRATWMARPHVGLSWMAVRPEYRQRGVGSALMTWGVQRADELGVEAFIEASDLGKLLYAKFGFHEIETVSTGPMPNTNNDAGNSSNPEREAFVNANRLQHGFTFVTMCRPVGGQWNAKCDEIWNERKQKFSTLK